MPPSKIRTSEAVSKRRVDRARALWIDYFSSALDSLLSTDRDEIKELTDSEADEITRSAALIADKALERTEERFQGL